MDAANLDGMCASIREAVFSARTAGEALDDIVGESLSALENALADLPDLEIGG